MQQSNPAMNAAQMQGMMGVMVIGGAIFMFILQIIMPVLFLTVWRGPSVAAAFEARRQWPRQQAIPDPIVIDPRL